MNVWTIGQWAWLAAFAALAVAAHFINAHERRRMAQRRREIMREVGALAGRKPGHR